MGCCFSTEDSTERKTLFANPRDFQDENIITVKSTESVNPISTIQTTVTLTASIQPISQMNNNISKSEKVHSRCEYCANIFQRKAKDNWRRFCNKECSEKFNAGNIEQREDCICQKCNKKFQRKKKDTWRIFCSKECSNKK